jgi:hypothetical protein
MSSTDQQPQVVVMLVTAPARPGLSEWCGPLESAGASVHVVPDVYAAMAALADDSAAQHVIVDERELDDAESNFLTLAPQYFDIRVHRYPDNNGGVDQFLAVLLGGETESAIDSLVENGSDSEILPVQRPSVVDEPGQSMHDAVRARMSADAPPAAARRAPQSRPPALEVRHEAAESGLSKEELDALLAAGQEMEDGPTMADEEPLA